MMLVEHILEPAKKRLATLRPESLICHAAEILMNGSTPLIVVCDGDGVAVGVVSRTDVVKVLVGAKPDAFSTNASAMMTRDFLFCQLSQPLQEVWKIMNARSLRCVPILDHDRRPQGIVHARDLASALLEDVTYEELLLRDYVLGIGYQ